jgi:hypothetical protein
MAAFTMITNTEVDASGVNEIQFTSIAGTYDHLYLVASLRTDTVDSALWDDIYLRVNSTSDAAFNSYTQLELSNTTPVSGRSTSGASIRIGRATASGADASFFNPLEMWIPNYTGTVGNKPILVSNMILGDASSSTYWRYFELAALHAPTTPAAITQLDLHMAHGTDLFVQYSNATLYGVTGA